MRQVISSSPPTHVGSQFGELTRTLRYSDTANELRLAEASEEGGAVDSSTVVLLLSYMVHDPSCPASSAPNEVQSPVFSPHPHCLDAAGMSSSDSCGLAIATAGEAPPFRLMLNRKAVCGWRGRW